MLNGSFGFRLTRHDTKREMSSSVSLTRSASEDSFAGTRWVEMQTRCFLRRVESKLHFEQVEVQSARDLTDGVVLACLMETLTGKNVAGVVLHPQNKFQEAVNWDNTVLFIKNQGVRLVDIGPSDINNGETKIVPGLLWVLILHFENNGNQQDFADTSLTDSNELTHRVQRNRSFRYPTTERPVDGLLEWVQSKIPEQHSQNFTTSWNDGWNLFRLVEALDGRAFEQVPTNTAERVVFALKYADEKMDLPALLDACDMTDPMVDHKSMMTYIAQFRAYEQRKRAAVRDHRNTATIHCSQERRVDEPSEFQRCDARAQSALPSSSTRPRRPSSSATSSVLLSTLARPTGGGANPFSQSPSLRMTRQHDWCTRRRSFLTDSPPTLVVLLSAVLSSLTRRRPRGLSFPRGRH